MKLTVIILTKNEEKNIERALKSISFCEEILIVDDGSVDTTIKKIQNSKLKNQIKSQIKILKHDSKGNFAAQRNWAMDQAKNDWALFIDADEVVVEELRKEIADVIASVAKQSVNGIAASSGTGLYLTPRNDKVVAYYIKRRDYWWGREMKYGETLKARSRGIIRLMKKGSGEWRGRVHEEFIPIGKTAKMDGFINHFPHQSLKEFIQDVNNYSSLRAHELYSLGKSGSIFDICLYPIAKFILTYFFYLGFLDKAAGFAYAFLMSFHSFLVRAKLYQYSKIGII